MNNGVSFLIHKTRKIMQVMCTPHLTVCILKGINVLGVPSHYDAHGLKVNKNAKMPMD